MPSVFGILVGNCHRIHHNDLKIHQACNIPKILSVDQKETQMSLAGDLTTIADGDKHFLNNTITEDKTWCLLYDTQAKC